MNHQIDISSSLSTTSPEPPAAPPPAAPETVELLRQMLEVQREQLAQLRASAAAHDSSSRWRAFLARWQQDFPDLSEGCRHALPILERAYGGLIAELADHLKLNGTGAIDNEFSLGEFLDRYGMRLGQLGTVLSLVAFLAEAAASRTLRIASVSILRAFISTPVPSSSLSLMVSFRSRERYALKHSITALIMPLVIIARTSTPRVIGSPFSPGTGDASTGRA